METIDWSRRTRENLIQKMWLWQMDELILWWEKIKKYLDKVGDSDEVSCLMKLMDKQIN